ncbi:uncharacterized protein METZ01_LOCUS233811 [marine metagenome]|uniref:Uncharacterized protein n=1 Tax=marine metagenome TaxID=408172 RepID=A0A382H1Z0_9ZZZZ
MIVLDLRTLKMHVLAFHFYVKTIINTKAPTLTILNGKQVLSLEDFFTAM